VTDNKNVKLDFLGNIRLFSSLTDGELLEVSNMVTLKEFVKNEIILHEEDTNAFMYIILFGKVKAIQTTRDGKEIIMAIHHSEEFFGEISLIDGKTSSASVVAMENSLVAIISKTDFYSLIFSQKKVLENLLHVLCSRLRESWERIHILNFKNSTDRIKTLYRALSYDRSEKTAEGVTVKFKLTHQDIANMTGLTRESVTRVLDKWKRDGEITVTKDKFINFRTGFLEEDLSL
jgi:CRP/FNR family transcriptional regulator